MAAQVESLSMPLNGGGKSSGGLITQVTQVLLRPVAFFKSMSNRNAWLPIAALILAIYGYTATTQIQSTSLQTTADSAVQITGNATSESEGFDLSLLAASATPAESITSATGSADTTAATSDETLMNALLAATGVLIVWFCQAVMLTLISMLSGYFPRMAKSFQIAIWASLPLAIMLILRNIHYASGGAGGSLGLSLLLESWGDYAALPVYGQRTIAVFLSNLTLFWLWNLMLLYFGARYALGGRRFVIVFVLAVWIALSTILPAFLSEPTTEATPREVNSTIVTTQQDNAADDSDTQNTGELLPGDDFTTDFGNFPGGGTRPEGGPPGS